MDQGYRNNQFGTDLLAQYLELYGYVPPNAYGIPATGGIQPTNCFGAGCFIRLHSIFGSSSANRRSVAPINVPPSPSRQIDTNEMLMRVGGRIMGGAAKVALMQWMQVSEEYGKIQDYNRSRELEDYNSKVLASILSSASTKSTDWR